MEADFWHDKWQRNEIGFHNSDIHPLLLRYWPTLGLASNARVLVPLAGKSLDLCWLLEQGHSVVAAELSKLAVDTFFSERQWSADIIEHANHTQYHHGQLDFWAGDLFTLDDKNLSVFDGLYDRAALIALAPDMRKRYVDLMHSLLKPGAKYLLISLEYPDHTRPGPPFAIDADNIAHLFQSGFSIHCHGRHPSELKGIPCFEAVYTLERLAP